MGGGGRKSINLHVVLFSHQLLTYCAVLFVLISLLKALMKIYSLLSRAKIKNGGFFEEYSSKSSSYIQYYTSDANVRSFQCHANPKEQVLLDVGVLFISKVLYCIVKNLTYGFYIH